MMKWIRFRYHLSVLCECGCHAFTATRHATNQSSDQTIIVLIKQNNTTILSVYFTVLIALTELKNHTMPGTHAFQSAMSKRAKHPLTYDEAGRVSGKLNEDLRLCFHLHRLNSNSHRLILYTYIHTEPGNTTPLRTQHGSFPNRTEMK